jgi:hypothetical protein
MKSIMEDRPWVRASSRPTGISERILGISKGAKSNDAWTSESDALVQVWMNWALEICRRK